MKNMVISRTYVDGLGEIVTSIGNLVTNVKELDGRLVSVSQEASARIQTCGKENIGRTDGTRVSMIINYLAEELPVLRKMQKFPIRLAIDLVQANSQNKYFSTTTSKVYEQARKKAEEEVRQGIAPKSRSCMVCPSNSDFSISPNENLEHYLFIFEDVAFQDEQNDRPSYFKLNNNQPIPVYLINPEIVNGYNPESLSALNGTIQNYFWFRSLDYRSGLDGDSRGAGSCDNRARRVLKKPAKLVSQKISPREIKVRIPTLSEILKYSQPFVAEKSRPDFEEGLRGLYKQ